MNEPEFAGLAAVVTGGASPVGLATARLLAARGARVACLDLRPGTVPEPLIRAHVDVTDSESVRAGMVWAAELLGGIDVLVNNAETVPRGGTEDASDEEWRQAFEVNVLGVLRTSRAALPHLRRSAAPVIVNTCSAAAGTGLPDRVLYSASKGALLSMTRAMAADLAAEGIRVCCVSPGPVDAPHLLPKQRTGSQEHRPADAEQRTAAAIAYLASPLAAAATGTDLPVA
ncbi:oxidoreductase [Kitasatospora phosalacinea]|uniref:Oxidoreductase n=1 Tax=Kitasatospora phosalacinea TaxID=2065 RepID=A0A9W6QF99_9ACTN|nr:SDR family oxidoreductase [Kitasatospora phosalacinea]GLW73793.1 oxidoreductase [Kitasatospora phosalacinea]